jgi:hypothetical protein
VADWEKVVFSDESRFNLFGTDGVKYIRRPRNSRYMPKYMEPAVKHAGGNVMVWGCFSANGTGTPHRIQGRMDSLTYRDIINNLMVPYACQNMPPDWIFQHDNDPKHTAGLLTDYFRTKKINVMSWPSQPPDLNPIEHLWEALERRVRCKRVKNASEKFALLSQEWAAMDNETIRTLVESMPRRCKAVIDSKGYPTKY